MAPLLIEPAGQGWLQAGELGLAFVLSSLIGLERELRQKSAGVRTHALVGLGAALIMLVSKYGFGDVLGAHVNLDPSRVAAQIVTGIGFIGGGLIFVRRDAVQGLTTAAVVWLTAAVGMAAGAGLPILALLATGGHFVVTFGYPPLMKRLPRSRFSPARLTLTYGDGRGVLRRAVEMCTLAGFTVVQLSSRRTGEPDEAVATPRLPVSVTLAVQGRGTLAELAAELSEIPGMFSVRAHDEASESDE
ncbi:MAG: MgtC/SapB family protein [Nocardioidaceae bacterium]